MESQIVNNTLYGVRNFTPTKAVLATNNWWGDAGGPQSDVVGCSSGLGDPVTSGVLFKPFLTTQITTNNELTGQSSAPMGKVILNLVPFSMLLSRFPLICSVSIWTKTNPRLFDPSG